MGMVQEVIDPRRIYLQPRCCADDSYEGRQWCEDDVWECEDGGKPTEYVLATTAAAEADALRAMVFQQGENAATAAKEYAENMAALRERVAVLEGQLRLSAKTCPQCEGEGKYRPRGFRASVPCEFCEVARAALGEQP